MQAELYEIIPCPRGRLATMPRPRGGEWLGRELLSLQVRGVTDVVSLLPLAEEMELGLAAEADYCAELGMRFHRHPLPDRGVPKQPAFDDFISTLLPHLTQPGSQPGAQSGFVAIHCRAGIGRSTVVAAALLCRLGLSAEEAVGLISQARGFDVPDTDEQLDFIYALDQGKNSSPS